MCRLYADTSRDPCGCDQTLLDYTVETFDKVVTSGQFRVLKPRCSVGSPMLFALYRSNVVQMSVLGYAICAAIITACVDDPPPKLLRLQDLTDRARQAVCNEIGSIKSKPAFDPVHFPAATSEDPVEVDLDWGSRAMRVCIFPRIR
jgi:hypothetical protein